MKKKLLALVITVLSALTLLTGCLNLNFGGPSTGGGGEDTPKENLIFDENSELNVILGDDVDGQLGSNLYDKLLYSKPTAGWKNTSAEKIEHEIVLGNDTGREITEAALMRLERLDDKKMGEDDFAYVIYSDGSSVAIVYNEDHENVTMKLAFDAFVEIVLDKQELCLEPGVVRSHVFNIIDDYYTPLDEAHRKEVLDAAEARLGAETVNALKSMMGIYDERLIQWIAGLYDPCICVCLGMGEEECKNTEYCQAQGGGFYYSNSARDTVGFLPDLESTRQALDMLNLSGMTWMYGGNYRSGALPDGMMEAIGRYTLSLQTESDGYFRHPQWAHLADHDMRLNRDLSWATTLLNAAGMSPWYRTPTGIGGGGKPSSSAGELTTNVHKSSPVAVSKVVAVASYPAILESRETFRAELDRVTASLKISSYGTGSRLGTYVAQINARDRQIGTPEDPTPLLDMLYNWYEENKNPERGTWVGDEEYGGNPKQIGAYAETNGVMKIIGTYSNAKKPYSYGIEAMHACIDVLTTEEVPTGTVDIYNAWIALNGVYSAVVKYNSPQEQEEAKALMQAFREDCVDEIIASRDKMLNFKCADGSFSYWPNTRGTAGSSMGMPTAIAGTKEGDVNGALIASADSWGHICSSLGITRIPIFGAAEMYKFRKWIESNGAVIKQGASLDYTVVDFEGDEVGQEPTGNLTYGLNSEGTSALVAYDGVNDNSYLEFISKKVEGSAGGNFVNSVCESRASAASFIFEGDICLKEANTEVCFQIQVGNIDYFILAKKVGNKVKLIEQSSDNATHSIDMDLGVDINMGEWFRLKVVYYKGDHDTVRIKVYFDNLSDGEDELKLIAVSDNYWDQYGNKNNGEGKPKNNMGSTKIYALKSFEGVILLDNLASYKSKEVYSPESDPNNQPAYNVDPPECDELKYEFEDGEISENITVSGNAAVVDGADGKELKLGASTAIEVPINHRKVGGKCAGVSFDITVPKNVAVGDVLTLTESEPIGNIFSLVFTVKEDADGKYVTCYEKNEAVGSVLSTVRIPVGEKVRVAVDYHHNEDVALIYVDDAFVAATGFIYQNGQKRSIRTLTLTTTAAESGLTVDNLIFEKNGNSYADATKPKYESVVHTFDGSLGDGVKVENGAKLDSFAGSGAVLVPKETKAGSLTVNVNHRADIFSVVRFSAAFSYQTANSNGSAHTVSFVDNDGNKIFALCFKIADSLVEVYEVGASGVGQMSLFSFNKADTVKITVELYQGERVAHIYLGDACVAKTSVFASVENMEKTPMRAVIAATDVKSKLYVDNLKVESLYELYADPELKKTVANTDSSNPLDFEKSNTGSIPSGIIKGSKIFRVENVYNTVKGEYSNVGVLETIRGRNDKIGITMSGSNSKSCVIFETDFMIENPEDTNITQFFFTNSKNEPKDNSAFGLIFQKSGNGFDIKVHANEAITNVVVASGLKLGEWYNLRIEYYPNGDADTRIKVFINGKLEYVTDKHYTTGKGDAMVEVKSAFFYTLLNSKASIYIDNMSLTTTNDTCNDSVGDK